MFFEIKNLDVSYEGAEAVKHLSLKVNEKEIVTLIGSNGAGKSTVLMAISALKEIDSGEIWFEDKRIDHLPTNRIVKMGISHVPQGRGLFPNMAVSDNLILGAYIDNNNKSVKEKMQEVYDLFPKLKYRRNQFAGTMSGGEQQMLAIACALMASPKLLLLDEPSLGLAPLVIQEMGNYISSINQVSNTSILLVEQNAKLALAISHRGYVIETGSVVMEGRSEHLMKDKKLKRAYLGI